MQPADDVNPYAAPSAPVDEVGVGGGYAGFKRISTSGVLLLLIVTHGIYSAYWLYSRGKRFNEVTQSDSFSTGVARALVVAVLASVVVDVLDSVLPQRVPLLPYALVNLICLVLELVCCFDFRRCLNEDDDIDWVGGVGTFLFQVLYLNYRLNQRIDAEPAALHPS